MASTYMGTHAHAFKHTHKHTVTHKICHTFYRMAPSCHVTLHNVSALLCCSSKFTVGYPGDSCIQKDDASRMREIVFQKVLRHHTASLFTDFMDRGTPASWREKKPAVLLHQRCLERIPTSFPRCSHRDRMCHRLSMNT